MEEEIEQKEKEPFIVIPYDMGAKGQWYIFYFLSGFSARGGGQISILKIFIWGGGGAPHFFSIYVQVSLNFLFSMHITTGTSISAYMDLLATSIKGI